MKFFIASILFLPVAAIADGTNTLPALAPPLPEMPPTFWQLHGTAILVGVFVFLAVAGFVAWQFFKSRPRIVLPPAVIARDALVKLLCQPEDGRTLSAISQILRRYVSAALEFPAGELTTTEFSAALADSEKAGADLAQSLSNFLRECDERKFSPANVTSPLNAAARALELVERIERRKVEPRAQTPATR